MDYGMQLVLIHIIFLVKIVCHVNILLIFIIVVTFTVIILVLLLIIVIHRVIPRFPNGRKVRPLFGYPLESLYSTR